MSDHFDGPRMLAEPVIDITDLYAFPSPETGQLVLVMNVFPFAGNSAFFSDGAVYKFRIRRAEVRSSGQKPACDIDSQEFDFTFTFTAPIQQNGSTQLIQQGICTTPTGNTVSFQVHDLRGTQAAGLRLFAGLRLDPFFADVIWVLQTTKHHRIAASSGENFINGANVLSIVLELEIATLFETQDLEAQDHSLLAIVAETWTAGKLPMRLARLGRPEIKNFTMSIPRADQVNRDLEIRDLHNQEAAQLSSVLSRTGQNAEAQHWRTVAAVRYDELITRYPEAFADHAARFWLEAGADPQKALQLAKKNAAVRQTPQAQRLLNRAAMRVEATNGKSKSIVV